MMKNVLSLVRVELKREVHSLRFYISIAGYLAMCCLVSSDYGKGGAMQHIDVMLGLSNTASLLVILAAFASACTFSDDWENGYYKFVVNRSSVRGYIWSKIITCAVSTFLISFVSFSLFGVMRYLQYGTGAENMYPGIAFYDLIHSDYNVFYIFIRAAVFSVIICIFSEYGLAGSAMFPNKFVAIAFPLISGIVLGELSDHLRVNGVTLYAIKPCALHTKFQYGIAIMMVLGYGLAANLIFVWVVRRRIRCEIN